jgi:Ca2+-binding EF-hand superfamily protein
MTIGPAKPASSANITDADVRHVVLMLERAPLHLRLRIKLGDQSLSAARGAYVAALHRQLDQDRDGVLSVAEAARSPVLRQDDPARDAELLRAIGLQPSAAALDVAKMITRVAGETVIYRQDDSATESDGRLFELFDDDGSGIVDAREMATASSRLARLDVDGDGCVGYDEVQPAPPEPPQDEPLPMMESQQPEPPRFTFSELARDTRDPLLPRRLLRKYDRDGTGQLSAAELNWTSEQLATIDDSGDDALSVTELHDIAASPVDLDLEIDLEASDATKSLAIIGTTRPNIHIDAQARLARVRFDDATVTFSYRHLDAVAEALTVARRRFNQLDADANGYLEVSEVQTDVRLRRGLFDAIDADSNGKVFGEEVETYVRQRGEPVVLTCQVNVYDTGSGFFHALDHNNDGRISMRELRSIDDSLRQLQRDNRDGVTLEEPARHFHVEFVRGSFQLFGPPEGAVSQLPAFQRATPVGPIWFQRMDRNNDGDLSWNEFLGHREDFYRLDTDRDELLNAAEAEKAVAD